MKSGLVYLEKQLKKLCCAWDLPEGLDSGSYILKIVSSE